MPPSKRARAYARRRQSEWEARQRRSAALRRRRAVLAAVVIGTLVLGTAAGAIVLASQPAATPPTAAQDIPSFSAAPSPAEAQGRTWTAEMTTSRGAITLELDGAAAPQAVASFLMLAREGFYTDITCHRLVLGTLIQCGDPTQTGLGGPGYLFGPIENAPEDGQYPAGSVVMARFADDPDSQGSQFFVMLSDGVIEDDAAGGYTVFGRVTAGMDVLAEAAGSGTVGAGPDGVPVVRLTIEGVVIS